MALDINALKSKLNSFKRVGGGDRDTAIWKPKEGKTVIRIVRRRKERQSSVSFRGRTTPRIPLSNSTSTI